MCTHIHTASWGHVHPHECCHVGSCAPTNFRQVLRLLMGRLGGLNFRNIAIDVALRDIVLPVVRLPQVLSALSYHRSTCLNLEVCMHMET